MRGRSRVQPFPQGAATMSCLIYTSSSRRLGSSLRGFLSLSTIVFTLLGGFGCGQAAQAPVELACQDMDMDRHEHSIGAIDSMMPHQQHTGPHRRPYGRRVPMTSSVPMRSFARSVGRLPDTRIIGSPSTKGLRRSIRSASRSITILSTGNTGSRRSFALMRLNRLPCCIRKPKMVTSSRGPCIQPQEARVKTS